MTARKTRPVKPVTWHGPLVLPERPDRPAPVRDPVEVLAREICWAGFTTTSPRMVSCTKAAYWREISQDARDDYLNEARRFIFLYHRIPCDVLNACELAMAKKTPVTPAPQRRRKS